MLAKVDLTPYFGVEMWAVLSVARSIPQLCTLLDVQSSASEHHKRKEEKKKPPKTLTH